MTGILSRGRGLALTVLLSVTGCTMPSTVVRTSDTRPSLAVVGAPACAVLMVDGNEVGPAATYAGNPTVLRVEPGTHVVEISCPGGASLFSQRVFVESELKTIEVH
jgi:hypothetical protein